MKHQEGRKSLPPYAFARRPRILVVEARFYSDISDLLAQGALQALEPVGAIVERLEVPGALELPASIRIVHEGTQQGKHTPYDAYVALGCVIRGETGHYDIVAGESARGLVDLGRTQGLAIGNGILTVETHEQAIERADPLRLDKGGGAAAAALALLALRARFGLF